MRAIMTNEDCVRACVELCAQLGMRVEAALLAYVRTLASRDGSRPGGGRCARRASQLLAVQLPPLCPAPWAWAPEGGQYGIAPSVALDCPCSGCARPAIVPVRACEWPRTGLKSLDTGSLS